MPDSTNKLGQALAKVPIFSGLTESELGFLTQRTVPRHYSAGEMVFGEGEPCSGLYVVESGNVRIYKSLPPGANKYSALMARAVPSPRFLSLMGAPTRRRLPRPTTPPCCL